MTAPNLWRPRLPGASTISQQSRSLELIASCTRMYGFKKGPGTGVARPSALRPSRLTGSSGGHQAPELEGWRRGRTPRAEGPSHSNRQATLGDGLIASRGGSTAFACTCSEAQEAASPWRSIRSPCSEVDSVARLAGERSWKGRASRTCCQGESGRWCCRACGQEGWCGRLTTGRPVEVVTTS